MAIELVPRISLTSNPPSSPSTPHHTTKFSLRPSYRPSMRMRVIRVGRSRIVAPVPDRVHGSGLASTRTPCVSLRSPSCTTRISADPGPSPVYRYRSPSRFRRSTLAADDVTPDSSLSLTPSRTMFTRKWPVSPVMIAVGGNGSNSYSIVGSGSSVGGGGVTTADGAGGGCVGAVGAGGSSPHEIASVQMTVARAAVERTLWPFSTPT